MEDALRFNGVTKFSPERHVSPAGLLVRVLDTDGNVVAEHKTGETKISRIHWDHGTEIAKRKKDRRGRNAEFAPL